MFANQTITFYADNHQLVGTLHRPDKTDPPVVIGCHGLFANRHSPKQLSLAAACYKNGMAYFRFDHRGCGDSQGEFSKDTSLATRRQDLYHAIQTMQHYSGLGPIAGLFGSSFGGTVVLSYAARHPSPAIVSYAAPVNSDTINHDHIRDSNGLLPSSTDLTESLSFDLVPILGNVSNVLVIHSQDDETVPVKHAHLIHEKVCHPKNLVVFEGGDHRMSSSQHQQQLESDFLDWLIGNQ